MNEKLREPARTAAMAMALALAVLAAYWPGLAGGFVFDDFPNIVSNARLNGPKHHLADWLAAAFSSPASDLQRPLSMLTFAVNSYFTGLDPSPMKLTNLAIHLLTVILLFALVRKLLEAAVGHDRPENAWLAVAAAAFWALSPINLTAVLYVVQRMESLSHVFVFVGLLLYCSGRMRLRHQLPGAWRLIVLALGPCTIIGLLAKESAALLPLYCFLLEVFVFRFEAPGLSPRRLKAVYVLVLLVPGLLAVAWLLPRSMEPGAFAARDFTLYERLLSEPRAIASYLRWIVLPSPAQMSLFHDEFLPSRSLWNPPSTLPAMAALAAGLWLAWRLRLRWPLASLGLAWFFVAHLITGTFLPLELMFEHRNYFASAGVCLVLMEVLRGLLDISTRRSLTWFVAAVSLFVVGLFTHIRALEWSNPLALSATEVAKHPESARATYDLGRTLVIMGGYDPRSPFTLRALEVLEKSRLAHGSGVLPEQALLLTASRARLPMRHEWWDSLSAKLAAKPAGPQELAAIQALTRCSVEKACAFAPDDMLGMFSSALSRESHPEVLNTFGDYALNVLDDPKLALSLWDEAVNLSPRQVQYQVNRTRLQIALGRFGEAEQSITRIRQLGRLGQYQSIADELTRSLQQARNRAGVAE